MENITFNTYRSPAASTIIRKVSRTCKHNVAVKQHQKINTLFLKLCKCCRTIQKSLFVIDKFFLSGLAVCGLFCKICKELDLLIVEYINAPNRALPALPVPNRGRSAKSGCSSRLSCSFVRYSFGIQQQPYG